MGKEFLTPLAPLANPIGHAKLVLASVGLQFVKPRFFKIDEQRMNDESNDFDANRTGGTTKKSIFGTPIFDTFTIHPFSYTNLKGEVITSASSYSFETALIEVNQTKNIVITPIAGGDGTVKEYVGLQDYNISITGLIVGKLANTPIDITQLDIISSILNAPIPLPVSCQVFDFLGIDSVVVTDFRFGQIQGTRNAMSVTINCISDTPFEVEYNTSKKSITQSGSVPSITF